MLTAILKFLTSLFDFVRWWKRPSKEIKKIEQERDRQKAKDAQLVTEGKDEEMVDRIRNM
jgi:hypothetical protein